MKNILILNLGKTRDIINSAHLVNSYKQENPGANVSMLVLEKCKSHAQIIEGLTNVYTLNSEFLTKVIENQLYSDAFAINEFSNNLEEALSTKWETIFNYSNDTASALLMMAFNSEKRVGTFIDQNGSAKTTGQWETYQNFSMTTSNRYKINPTSVRNHIMKTPILNDVLKIKIDEQYLAIANQNFSKIRQMKGPESKYIIGINLEIGDDGYALEETSLHTIIEAINEYEMYSVVLLTSGKSYQREIVNNLNKSFDNKLISINVDTLAISAVVANLDMLVSCANNQLYVSDVLETKIVEVREGKNIVTPAVMNLGSYVVYSKENETIANDIILALNEEFNTELPITTLQTNNPTFISTVDDYGLLFSQIRGEINLQAEVHYHIERATQYQLLGYDTNQELINNLRENINPIELKNIVLPIKSELTNAVKYLLNTLRSIKNIKNSQSSINQFIESLDELIKLGEVKDSVVSPVIKFFEGNIENIDSTSIDENIKEIETHLFSLKANLQIISNFTSSLVEEKVINQDGHKNLDL